MRLELALGRPGRYECTFRLRRAADHGLEFCLQTTPAPPGIEELREEAEGLAAVARMYDESGELVDEVELTARAFSRDTRTHPPIPLPGYVWFHMPGPPPGSDYRIVVDVLRPAKRWAESRQTLVGRCLPCPMVLMARTVGYLIAGFLLLAGLLLAFAAYRCGRRRTVKEPRTPPPKGGMAETPTGNGEN